VRICISSGQRGGVGKSTIAVISSGLLSRLSDVLLLDVSFASPTSSTILGSGDGLDLADYIYGRAKAKDVVEHVGGGLYVVRRRPSPELPPGDYVKLKPLMSEFPYVVVDFPAFAVGHNIYTYILYKLCDKVLLVGDLDVISVRALEPLAKTIEDKVVVLNRYERLLDYKGRIEREYKRLGEVHKVPEDNVLKVSRILLKNPLLVPSRGVLAVAKLVIKLVESKR